MYFSVFTYLKVGKKDFEAQNRYYFNVSFSKLTKNIKFGEAASLISHLSCEDPNGPPVLIEGYF